MRKVGHDGHVSPAFDDPLQQPKSIISVGVSDEPVWPVGHGLGAEPDSGNVVQGGVVQDGVYIGKS